MTEIEAIKELKSNLAYSLSSECREMAIQALEEIQQYRAIGTVEELKSMKENGAFSGVELAQIATIQMKFKEYRDAEEQGLLLRLPLEVGKEIYVLTKSFDVMKNCMSTIIEVFEVREFRYNFLKNFVIVGIHKKHGFYERHYFLGEIGKTVFLTREEAEQALAEMKGGGE